MYSIGIILLSYADLVPAYPRGKGKREMDRRIKIHPLAKFAINKLKRILRATVGGLLRRQVARSEFSQTPLTIFLYMLFNRNLRPDLHAYTDKSVRFFSFPPSLSLSLSLSFYCTLNFV